jgi:hypothetical protein
MYLLLGEDPRITWGLASLNPSPPMAFDSMFQLYLGSEVRLVVHHAASPDNL